LLTKFLIQALYSNAPLNFFLSHKEDCYLIITSNHFKAQALSGEIDGEADEIIKKIITDCVHQNIGGKETLFYKSCLYYICTINALELLKPQ